jgi:MFS transporter, putative metabolite:H+ symporter
MDSLAQSPASIWSQVCKPAVVVGALGYFVDIYDLVLFSIVRTSSLQSLGYSGQELVDYGILLLNLQMVGMLLGGILFGILGDRMGRVQLLFGSILLYSVANVANGFVQSIETFAIWRFIAGIGLAGELGGCITLVAESLSKELRGYGTAIVAGVGVLGAVVAALVADRVDWRVSYFIGGGMGLALLALRVGVAESGMFHKMTVAKEGVSRGNLWCLFNHGPRFAKYAKCILIGVPSWFVIGVLVTFSPELAQALKIEGVVKASYAVLFMYLGLSLGDLASGFLSQWFRSRKKIVGSFLLLTALGMALYFSTTGQSSPVFYAVIFLLGLGIGYWAVFVTIAAEQFGTNIRATVATTVPNFVRGAVVPITLAFDAGKGAYGILWGAALVGAGCLLLAAFALWGLEETYDKDLDYNEPV